MTSIFEDMNKIAELAGLNPVFTDDGEKISRSKQDAIDYTLISDTMADIEEISTRVLIDIRDDIQRELDGRVTCKHCGTHRHGFYAPGEWECPDCRKWK